MAREKTTADRKIPIDVVMAAVDRRDKEYWSRLPDEDRRLVNTYMAQRWASAVQSNDRDIQEHYLIMVNDLCNLDYVATTSDHEELRWKILSLVGLGFKLKHDFIRPRGVKKDRIREWLIDLMPHLGDDEIDLFREINPPDVLEESAKAMNLADKKVKDLFK